MVLLLRIVGCFVYVYTIQQNANHRLHIFPRTTQESIVSFH
uniref:Uncharacterized protein n=1 Tax=Arundo donax TaxID=35708 RepID=A0A0A9A0Q8_ARUDO